MPYTWDDPIDSTTDVFDVSLFNVISEAVHERVLAARSAEINFEVPTPTRPSSPAEKSAGDDLLKGLTTATFYETVADLQNAVGTAALSFVRRADYPTGLEGLATVPEDFTWSVYDLGGELGYPESPTSGWIRLWRRKTPRRIYSLTTTKNQEFYGTYYYLGSYYWSLGSFAECEVGDRAQYFEHAVIDPWSSPWSFLATSRTPGYYRGIYEYQGAGVWTPAPSGAAADTLDSLNTWNTHNWCTPGNFGVGDYYGYWLYDDLYRACKLLQWTTGASSFSSVAGAANGQHQTKSGSVSAQASAAAAQAGVAAALIAATPTATGGSAQWASIYIGSGSSWNATANSSRVRLTSPAYQNLGRSTDYYACSTKVGGGEYDDQGFGFLENQYANVETVAAGASSHAYAYEHASVIGGSYPVPNWSTTAGVWRGCQILNTAKYVTKWTFAKP